MDDRAIIESCASAMGVSLEWDGHPNEWQPIYYEGKTYHIYNPLHDDAQAMGLVKRFRLDVAPGEDFWMVVDWKTRNPKPVKDIDLNRAICLAVAMRGKDG